MAHILEVLERHPMFEGLTRHEISDLVIDCRYRTPFRGDRIFTAGEPAEAFYVVVGGDVKLASTSTSGRECVSEIVRAGETLALVSVLDGEPYPATASALTDCAVIRIPRGSFLRLLTRCPALRDRLTREVAAWMRRVRSRLEDIRTRTVPARVASHLVREAESQTGHAGRGSTVDLGATREVVATTIGTVREVFVRALHGFRRQGLIRIDGRRVEILEPERLRDLAEGSVHAAADAAPRADLAARGFVARRPVPAHVG